MPDEISFTVKSSILTMHKNRLEKINALPVFNTGVFLSTNVQHYY